MARYPYRDLGITLDRDFRNNLNANFDDIEADLRAIQSNLDAKESRLTQIENDSIERDNDLDARIDNIVADAGNSNTEIVDARNDSVNNVTYPTLKDRLDDTSNKIGNLSTIDWLPSSLSQAIIDLKNWINQRAINVRQPPYNCPANGVDDDSAKIQQAINDALTSMPVNGVGGQTYRVVRIYIPHGTYVFNNTVTWNPSVSSSYLGDTVMLVIEGAGYGTAFKIGTADTMFDIPNGTVYFSNIRMIGDAGKTGFKLGRPFLDGNGNFQVVSQSTFHRINMVYWEKFIDIGHCFDTSFYECGFFSAKGTSPIGLNVQLHDTDNTNNLQFYRCHWEGMVNGTFIKMQGAETSATRVHNNFGFYGCHFETRSFNTPILDLESVTRLIFIATQFTQNNVPSGANAGVTELDTVPMFKLKNVSGLSFDSATVSHIGSNPASLPNKIFDLAGTISGVSMRNSFFSTGVNATNQGTDALWQPNAITPPVFPNGRFATFIATHIDDIKTPAVFDDMEILTSSNARNRKWIRKHQSSTNNIEYFYDSTANGVTLGTPLFVQSTDGMFRSTSLGGGFMQTVANGATAIFSPPFNNNPNKRGIYRVMADYNGDAFAMFYSSGSALYPIFTGNLCAVGTANPNVAGKLNIYLNGVNIAINNQLGSDRRISVVVEGFY